MAKTADYLICRHRFDTQHLVESYPPKLKHKNKKAVYAIACLPGCTHNGQLVFSRWRAMPLPGELTILMSFSMKTAQISTGLECASIDNEP